MNYIDKNTFKQLMAPQRSKSNRKRQHVTFDIIEPIYPQIPGQNL